MMKEENVLPKNEIDVLVEVFIKYRLIIAIVISISVVVSIAYAFFIYKPVYSATALVQIGKVNGRLIEPVTDLDAKLVEKYEIYINPKKSLPKISDIKKIKTSQGIIRLTAQGHDKENLKKYLEEQVQVLILDHSVSYREHIEEYSENKTVFQNRLNVAKAELRKIKTDIKTNDQEIDKLTNDQQALINMYMIKMLRANILFESTTKKITSYYSQLNKYKRFLQTVRTYPTDLTSGVIMQNKIVGPSRMMIVIIGSVSGFLLSLLIALFLSSFTLKRD